MFIQFFGDYLYNNKMLTLDQLREVLNLQSDTRVKLGVLAIDAKYMTGEQVEKVHNLQTIVDRRFGELAVEEGFLTEQQLNQLLGRQMKNYLLLGQALLDKGYFNYEQLEEQLNAFKEAAQISDLEFEAIKNDDVETIVEVFLKVKGNDETKFYRNSFTLFAKNIVRFVDTNFHFGHGDLVEEYPFDCLNFVLMEGSHPHQLLMGFAGEQKTLHQFANQYAQATFENKDKTVNADVIDALVEFLNVTAGLFLASMSNDGIDLELTPPTTVENKTLGGSKIFKVPVHLPFGKLDFVMALGDTNIG